MLSLDSAISLSNNTEIPRLGLGVWQIPDGTATERAVTWALEAGYRHIDTAKIYQNERGVGKAIRESGLSRSDIWVTTKLWPADQLQANKALAASLERLGLEYVDLYLVHFPIPGFVTKTWKAMEQLAASGRCLAIGVSNHSIGQVDQILKMAQVPPAVNQIQFSPFHHDMKLLKFCTEHGIAVEAYSPLTRGHRLADQTLVEVAGRYHKSPAQILIRWALQHQMVVLPKSQNQGRIVENAAVYDFELGTADMTTLDRLSA